MGSLLSISGSGRVLRIVAPEAAGVAQEGILVDVEIPDHDGSDASTVLRLYWMCDEAARKTWLSLDVERKAHVVHFSGIGPRLRAEAGPLFELVASSLSLDISVLSGVHPSQ